MLEPTRFTYHFPAGYEIQRIIPCRGLETCYILRAENSSNTVMWIIFFKRPADVNWSSGDVTWVNTT
jgi:hypothetical protein